MPNNIVPEWLKPYITEEAYIALKEHIEQLDPQSREEMILKYIALKELSPLIFKLNGKVIGEYNGETPLDLDLVLGNLTIQKNGETVGTYDGSESKNVNLSMGVLTIQKNGETLGTYNGSEAKNIDINMKDLTIQKNGTTIGTYNGTNSKNIDINLSTLTIQKNGETIGTYNGDLNKIVNISVPRITYGAGAPSGGNNGEAIIMGKDKPPMFRASLVDTIINAGAHSPTTTNFYNDTDLAMSKVEACGYIPNAIMGGVGLRSDLRRVVDTTGQPIHAGWLEGLDKIFVDNSAWDSSKAKYIVGDFKKCVYAIRQDIEFEIFTQGSITNPDTGLTIYNLMQQDMIAARCTMRLGWEVPNPVNILEPNSLVRFPLAMVDANPAITTYDVTFTVTDGSKPIENASVTLGSMKAKTNSNGKTVFKLQSNTTANYLVKAEGKSSVKGKVSVSSAATEVNVVMN